MSKYSLEKHIHENVRPFNHDTCGKIFKSNSNLKDHVTQVHHNIKSWKLTNHQKKKPYVCDKCGKAFLKKSR